MQNVNFENDPLCRKVTRYFLFFEIGVMILVLGLMALKISSGALCISFVSVLFFGAVILRFYLRYQRVPIVREKRDLMQKGDVLERNIKEQLRVLEEIKRNRSSLFDAEQNEINNGLQGLQKQYIQNGLSSALIKDAVIPGIGPKLKERLMLEGIITAAEVSSNKIAQVQGFGDTKRSAVIGWQSEVLS